ncbi:MAG: hypothetical protein R3D29_15635 [Nitratireductor sp.]
MPINFDESREAMQMNLETRKEAVRLLKEGVTIVVFPAGGVATAPRGSAEPRTCPGKMFPARMIQRPLAHRSCRFTSRARMGDLFSPGQQGR